jgi:tRNA-binding protein
MTGFDAFMQTDIRVGKIVDVQEFPEARKPAYKLTIDLGPEIGIKKSSAQLVAHYSKEELLNTLVLCLVNVQPRKIGGFMSEVLTLGVPAADKECVLIRPDHRALVGGKLY